MTTDDHITVCVCTYRRAELLARLLQRLGEQKTGGRFSTDIVIVDNDSRRSAEATVRSLADRVPVPVTYDCEPVQNIALARNRALSHTRGSFVAFIDDDEMPGRYWLETLYRACSDFKADGVLGPVLPSYESEPPAWIVRGGFYERPSHRTGEVLPWWNTRTGNVLFRRSLLDDGVEWFRPAFGSGGEDRDFFRRMIGRGRTFVWCAEAFVFETVPAERCTRSFLVRRALLRGQLPHFTRRDLLRSLVAVPLYTSLLPMLLILGHHLFMQYLVKDCDHIGRIFAFLGMPLIKERYVLE